MFQKIEFVDAEVDFARGGFLVFVQEIEHREYPDAIQKTDMYRLKVAIYVFFLFCSILLKLNLGAVRSLLRDIYLQDTMVIKNV
ncbi:MAG: hypothetical protein LUE14_11890 [Clostridiales bacterium]|nr:hypothetical protein [Clostridiales bacterium]